MDEQKYLNERVDDQIGWMEKKAAYNQTRFKRLRMLSLAASAFIPFLAAMISDERDYLKWVTGGLGIVITISEGLQALYKYQDLWVQYRNTAETLKSEKLLFLSKAGPYQDAAAPFTAFVARVEAILSQENIQWKTQIEKIEKIK